MSSPLKLYPAEKNALLAKSLRRMLSLHERMMNEADHANTCWSAETVCEMNQALIEAMEQLDTLSYTDTTVVITCVYCGHQFPGGTPAAKHKLLTDHIKICQKHPMREAEAKIQLLRGALIGVVGSDHPKEWDSMEALLQAHSATNPSEENDVAISVSAIKALRETAEQPYRATEALD